MKLRSQKGLTLLEVLISALVLTLGILGLSPLMVIAMHANSHSGDLNQATMLAQTRLERTKQITSYPMIPYEVTEDTIKGLYDIVTRVDDTSSDGTVPTNLYKISVSVGWDGKAGVRRNFGFYTYKPM